MKGTRQNGLVVHFKSFFKIYSALPNFWPIIKYLAPTVKRSAIHMRNKTCKLVKITCQWATFRHNNMFASFSTVPEGREDYQLPCSITDLFIFISRLCFGYNAMLSHRKSFMGLQRSGKTTRTTGLDKFSLVFLALGQLILLEYQPRAGGSSPTQTVIIVSHHRYAEGQIKQFITCKFHVFNFKVLQIQHFQLQGKKSSASPLWSVNECPQLDFNSLQGNIVNISL